MQKSHLLPTAVVGGLLLCALPSLGADSHAKDRQQIIAAYNKMDAAFQAKDADASVAPLAPDFVGFGPDGKVESHSKKEEREKWSQVFAQIVDGTDTTTVDSITFTRAGATVAETDDGSGHILVNGHTHTVSHHSTNRDFWVKSGNAWLQKRSRTITDQRTADGQPIP